jgi:hypothetical protein
MSITAADVRGWIEDYASVIAEHRVELVQLDTAIRGECSRRSASGPFLGAGPRGFPFDIQL